MVINIIEIFNCRYHQWYQSHSELFFIELLHNTPLPTDGLLYPKDANNLSVWTSTNKAIQSLNITRLRKLYKYRIVVLEGFLKILYFWWRTRGCRPSSRLSDQWVLNLWLLNQYNFQHILFLFLQARRFHWNHCMLCIF